VYVVVLLLHSWLRWVVLALGLALLAVATRDWVIRAERRPRSDVLARMFLRALDTQVLAGLVLYALLSPLPRAGVSDLGAGLSDPVLRFYSIEHVFGMVVAVGLAHVGLGRARSSDVARRSRAVAVTMLLWLVVTLASVPWPGLAYGRPLFRLG
jgi:hypothetical protein